MINSSTSSSLATPAIRARPASSVAVNNTGLRKRMLAVAIAAAAMTSVSAAQQRAPIAAATNPAAVAAPAAAEQTVVIDGNGAVYLTRRDGMLHFWVVNEGEGTVERKQSFRLDNYDARTLAIELGARTSGLFFADNIVQPDDAFRLSFRGEVEHANIALPLVERAFEPLWAVTVPDDVVQVTPEQTDLLALLLAQQAIYQRVSDVAQLHDSQVDQFRSDMQHELISTYDLMTTEAQNGQRLIDSAAGSAQGMQDRFVAQSIIDGGRIQAAADTAENFGLTQTRAFESASLPCIEAARMKVDQEMSALAAVVDATPDDEQLHERTEAAIAQSASGIARHQAAVEACVNTAALDAYAPTLEIDENGAGYLSIDKAAQSLEANTEVAIARWAQAVEDQGLAQGARLESAALASEMLDYQGYFSEWLSPVYADEGEPDADGENAAAQASAKLPVSRVADQTRSDEKLCDDETWNVEFSFVGFSVVFATPWNDRVVTGNNNNLIFTFRGDDCIESHAGYDAVFAGPGRDRIYGGDDHDFLFGGRDGDEIHGSAGNTYTVTVGAVTLAFDIGNLIIGQAGSDVLYGGEVFADRGEDGSVDSHGYADLILGDSFLFGGPAGNDTIFGEMGVDFHFGQDGNDMLSNLVPGVITINGLPVPFGTFFFGNDGNDSIFGSNTTIAGVFPLMGDFIFGNADNDMAQANAGMDFVFGNDGDDNLDAGRDTDFAFGNTGNDVVTGNDGSDLVSGDLGNDTVFGSPGLFDLVLGGQGNDRLFGNDGFDLIFGADGNDTIQGNNDIDLIFGGPAGDVINGNDGIDLIFGGAGEDLIGGDNGSDLIFGNRDSDTINGGDDLDVIFGNENSQKIETLSGNNGIDLIFGNDGPDRIFGNDGIDALFGNADRDEINGNNGVDLILGNDGNDILRGDDGLDLMFGNDGNDDMAGGNGVDVAFGNGGCDLIAGNADADLLMGNDGKDRIWGGDGLDLMFGNSGQDYMRGENGSDLLLGNDDNDSVGGDDGLDVSMGGNGDDFMEGGNNADLMLGGDGNDFARGDGGNDLVFGGNNNDTLDGASDGDLLMGQDGDDNINSGGGTDFSFGGNGGDRLRAVEGSNYAFGNDDNDVVDGYASSTPDPRDWLFGNSNNDTITGNKINQKDMRFGGSGSDSLHWNSTYVGISLFNGSWNGNSNCN